METLLDERFSPPLAALFAKSWSSSWSLIFVESMRARLANPTAWRGSGPRGASEKEKQ